MFTVRTDGSSEDRPEKTEKTEDSLDHDVLLLVKSDEAAVKAESSCLRYACTVCFYFRHSQGAAVLLLSHQGVTVGSCNL